MGRPKDRVRMSRITRKIYHIARQVTEDEGGGGPRVFLVDLDRQSDGFGQFNQ